MNTSSQINIMNKYKIYIYWQIFYLGTVDSNGFNFRKEPLGQFQSNLAQSILEWRGFKFVQMKKRKYIDKKFFFSRTTGPISTKVKHKSSLGEGYTRFYK